ncbi:ribosomal protein S6 [Plesiocystis pacifica SIR-1]|uniref:Small ribosomal subunit protein bS6 n=1 Tax=Plesiocystis pacifica SIR-1 TaxID=391625 RepID=A6G1R0_9BACT|nr:30S ribosomal protein S6 [Plesiocystis pacifica]EDM80100.1 ribosomal protein S6 [Plesiocystis pacifica SIR-1]
MSLATINSYSALRGTQREFEVTMILRPDTNKEGIQSLVARIQAIFDSNGGRMQKIDNWGLRTLAYPIQSQRKGIYLYVRFLGGSDMVKELERNFRIYPEVVRYLTVMVDENVNPEARPSDIDEEALDAASESAPDPIEVAAEKARAEAEAAAAEAAAAEAAAAEAAAADAPAPATENTENDNG